MERELVSVLERWASSGAVWRVLDRSDAEVTVGLYTCDGGEEVERLTTRDPATLEYLARRTSSES